MIKTIWILLAVSAVLAFQVTATEVRSCHSKAIIDNGSVQLEGCAKSPCLIRRNSTMEFKVKFRPAEKVKTLRNRTFVRMPGGKWMPVPTFNVCNFIYDINDEDERISCPLKRRETYLFKRDTPMGSMSPGNYEIYWSLVNQDDKEVACFENNLKLV